MNFLNSFSYYLAYYSQKEKVNTFKLYCFNFLHQNLFKHIYFVQKIVYFHLYEDLIQASVFV